MLAVTAVLLLVPVMWGARLGWQALARHPALVVRQVTVHGTDVASDEEILRLAAVSDDAPWLALDREAIARRVRRHPFVERVHVWRPWVGRLRIDVDECAAIARVEVDGRTYGLCSHLRLLPAGGEADAELPLLTEASGELVPDVLARGLAYVEALASRGVAGERLRVDLSAGPDRIRFLGAGLAVTVDPSVRPGPAMRNVAAFLETLDETGEARGTLRVISERTAVWRAA